MNNNENQQDNGRLNVIDELISIEKEILMLPGCKPADIQRMRLHLFRILASFKLNDFYIAFLEQKLIEEIGEEEYRKFMEEYGEKAVEQTKAIFESAMPEERRWQA